VICRANLRVEEEFPSVFIWPVFRKGVFGLLVVFDPIDKLFECTVFADEFKGCIWTNFGNRIEVIAAKEDAEINELLSISEFRTAA